MDLGSCRRIGFNFGGKSLAVVVEMVSVLLTYNRKGSFIILWDWTRRRLEADDRGGGIKVPDGDGRNYSCNWHLFILALVPIYPREIEYGL